MLCFAKLPAACRCPSCERAGSKTGLDDGLLRPPLMKIDLLRPQHAATRRPSSLGQAAQAKQTCPAAVKAVEELTDDSRVPQPARFACSASVFPSPIDLARPRRFLQCSPECTGQGQSQHKGKKEVTCAVFLPAPSTSYGPAALCRPEPDAKNTRTRQPQQTV